MSESVDPAAACVLWDAAPVDILALSGEACPARVRWVSHMMALSSRYVFRAIEYSRSDGTRDPHRSKYFINGHRVKHARFRRARKEAA